MELRKENAMERKLEIGSSVVYVTPKGERRNALVTAVWSDICCNAVFVTADETKKDTYGRQIERATSVVHKSMQAAPGNFWAWSDEAE
jgi:hypothetical protein